MIGSFLRKAQLIGGCAATAEPDVVTGLTATPSGSTTINLVWDADTTASPNEPSEYDIERSNDGSTGWSVIATISAPAVSYSDTTLSASTTRHYRIVAKNCADVANASTSASATTAAGSIGPSWSLDFSTGTPSGYTLTRASTGTYVDSSGYIASAATDVARLTHNSSGSRLGLLVEGQRTNLLQRSDDLANAYWTKTDSSIGSTSITAPDGTSTADELVENTANSSHNCLSGFTPVSGTTYTLTVYAKANTRSIVYLTGLGLIGAGKLPQFDLSAGTDVSVGTGMTTSITSVGSGWYRCRVTYTATGTGSAGFGILNAVQTTTNISYLGDGSSSVYCWGAQVEAASTESSYIPTTTTSGTREADKVHVLDSSITSWGDPGALVVHFYPPLQAGTLLSTDDASTAQVGIEASTTTAARAFWSSGSTATGTIGSGVQKAVHYWNGSSSKFCINGGTVQSGTNNLTIGNTDFVTLGAEATESGGVPGTFSQYANCVIRKVEFYSGTLTDANLQTITT